MNKEIIVFDKINIDVDDGDYSEQEELFKGWGLIDDNEKVVLIDVKSDRVDVHTIEKEIT